MLPDNNLLTYDRFPSRFYSDPSVHNGAYLRPVFRLEEDFIGSYRGSEPDWTPLGKFVFYRTYSRPKEGGGREEFADTLERIVNSCISVWINAARIGGVGRKFTDPEYWRPTARKMFTAMWEFRFLPPGRGLWMAGTRFVVGKGSMALNNCAFVSTRRIAEDGILPFIWSMNALMLGVGVGFDTEAAYLNDFRFVRPKGTYPHPIADSREGWCMSVGALINAYITGGPKPEFDYSRIRPAGSPIRGFGGTASGPGPLRELHVFLEDLLDGIVSDGKGRPTAADITDIFNAIAVCVVAGNVRRSAQLALGRPDDDTFFSLKWDPDRNGKIGWVANISAAVKRGADYGRFIDGIVRFGEPGFVWVDNIRTYGRLEDGPVISGGSRVPPEGVNPCGEVTLSSYELCCLAETFPSHHRNESEFMETLRLAYLYAKSITLLKTGWVVTDRVTSMNSRIGISQSGITEAFDMLGRGRVLEWCRRGYVFLRNYDRITSHIFGLTPSVGLTTVKPSGTVSLIAGVPPGIHYPYARYYIRRIRIASDSPLLPVMKKAGFPVVPDPYNGNTSVISFPVSVGNGKKITTADEVDPWMYLINASDYQRYWSDNAVSVTVPVGPEDSDKIPHMLRFFEDKLKGVTFAPYDPSAEYPLPPYEKIDRETYLGMIRRIRLPEFTASNVADGRPEGPAPCDGPLCVLPFTSGKKAGPKTGEGKRMKGRTG